MSTSIRLESFRSNGSLPRSLERRREAPGVALRADPGAGGPTPGQVLRQEPALSGEQALVPDASRPTERSRRRERLDLPPFGQEHMDILRKRGEGEEAKLAMDRWFRIALPSLQRWTRSALAGKGWGEDDRQEAFSYALEALDRRVRRGRFDLPAEKSDEVLLRVSFRRCLLSWVEAWRRAHALPGRTRKRAPATGSAPPPSETAPDANRAAAPGGQEPDTPTNRCPRRRAGSQVPLVQAAVVGVGPVVASQIGTTPGLVSFGDMVERGWGFGYLPGSGVPSPEDAVIDAEGQVQRDLLAEVRRDLVSALVTEPVSSLVLLLETRPLVVTLGDLQVAEARSGKSQGARSGGTRTDGLLRSAAEAWTLLEPRLGWLADPETPNAARRALVALALFSTARTTDPLQSDPLDRRRARNRLEARISRARKLCSTKLAGIPVGTRVLAGAGMDAGAERTVARS